MSQPFEWTKENYQKALELSKTKMTMTEIGKVLGTTKNAVLGKLHRKKRKMDTRKIKTETPGALVIITILKQLAKTHARYVIKSLIYRVSLIGFVCHVKKLIFIGVDNERKN